MATKKKDELRKAIQALKVAYQKKTLADDWFFGIGDAFLSHGEIIVETLTQSLTEAQTGNAWMPLPNPPTITGCKQVNNQPPDGKE